MLPRFGHNRGRTRFDPAGGCGGEVVEIRSPKAKGMSVKTSVQVKVVF